MLRLFCAFTKELMKLSPAGVNFTNILRAAFAPISFHQMNTNLSRKCKKLLERLLYKKAACKMLVELSPDLKISHKHLLGLMLGPLGLIICELIIELELLTGGILGPIGFIPIGPIEFMLC